MTMNPRTPRMFVAIVTLMAALGASALAADNPFLGGWELTIPGGGAGWLGVQDGDGHLRASLLWGGGSVVPLDSAKVEDGKLVVTREHPFQRKGQDGKTIKGTRTETITATLEGDRLELTTETPRENGNGVDKADFSGRREPPMPPAPDLSQVKFGQPIRLFNGTDLSGWRLTDPNAVSGWSVKDGILVNDVHQEEGKPHKNYGNLRTDRDFEDFNLTLEVRVPPDGNSGVYIRGIYEVQVMDSYGKPLDPHNMGAIYSRIKPTAAAEKPAGEWQTMDITFVDRHVTVVLNGTKIIDNQPIPGCTGGALWSDVTRPGPIYLQGDHTGIEYRNIVLRPRE
jgi:3-keto-disaccharide hydrolase